MEKKKTNTGRALFRKKDNSESVIADLKVRNEELSEKVRELQKIEVALRESEDKFRDIFENVTDGISYTTLSGKVIAINQRLEEILGLPKEKIVGKNVISLAGELLTSKNAGLVIPILKSLIKGKKIDPFRLEYKDKTLEIQSNINLSTKRLTGNIRDITSALKDNEARLKSEERLRRAEIASKSGNWELHLDTGIMFGSEGALRLYGSTKETHQYDVVKDVPLPEFRPLLDKAFKDLIDNNIPYNIKFKIKNALSGEIIDIHSISEYDRENRILFGSIQDITEQTNAEQEIKTKSSNLAKLLEISLVLLETVDRKSILSKVVEGVRGMQAMESGAVFILEGEGLNLEATYPHLPEDFPDEFRRASINDHLHIKKALAGLCPVIVSDTGNEIFTDKEQAIVDSRNLRSVIYLPMISGKKATGVLIFGTISNQHDFSEEEIDICRTLSSIASLALENSVLFDNLTRARDRAEESDKLKTAFLHNISHEIRTPLNAIVGFSGFLDQPDLSPSERQSYIDIIFQSNNQLLSIINDILNISLIDTGQVSIKESDVNLCQVLNTTFRQYQPEALQKNLEFRLKCYDAENDLWIVTDEIKLVHILNNLLSNAFKFTSKGYVELGAAINGNFIECYIEDTGLGIDPSEQKKIFDRFYQVDKSLSKVYSGMGLGLSISSAFLTLLGGTITLQSTPGKGSRFTIIIPAGGSSLKISDPSSKNYIPEPAMHGEFTILVAEDEDSNYALIDAILKPRAIKIIRALNGREAVDLCRQHEKIDLILMDIKMPEMGGLEATREILRFKPRIPIVAQSAYAHPADIEKASLAGCSGYLAKPFNRKQLLEIIEKHLPKK